MPRPDPRFDPSPFLAPRHWPTWVLLGIFRLLALLPFSWQIRMGAALGVVSRYLLPRRRRIVDTNVALAFPHLSPPQQHHLARETLRSSGIAVFETLYSWWGGAQRLQEMVRIEGMEHLHDAWRGEKGVLLLGGHFGCMMLCGRMLALQLPFHILVKRTRNPLFEALQRHYRELHYDGVIDSRNLRAMVRALRNNRICWYAPDQDFGPRQSVFAPFMGIPTATLTITARLATLSEAPVLPIGYRRLPHGAGYLITISPPLQGFPSGDELQDAARINMALEKQIEAAPEQYLWVHRRFKTRPPGESGLY